MRFGEYAVAKLYPDTVICRSGSPHDASTKTDQQKQIFDSTYIWFTTTFTIGKDLIFSSTDFIDIFELLLMNEC